MSGALLAADPVAQLLPEECFAGARPGAVGLRVHRNTVLAALAHALRLSYAAVDRLVGESFFDRMAVGYARAAPPRVPQLDEYGGGFAAWVATFPGTETLPYIGELARFEWAVGELGRQCVIAGGGPEIALEGGARLRFAAPLRVFESPYPVDALRVAILADDAAAVAALDLAPRPHHYALWRADEGVSVRALSSASARFVAAALAGADGVSALAAADAAVEAAAEAAVEAAAPQLAEILAREILPAGFVRVEAG